MLGSSSGPIRAGTDAVALPRGRMPWSVPMGAHDLRDLPTMHVLSHVCRQGLRRWPRRR